MTQDLEFFQEIEHVAVPWGETTLYVPVFYYDVMSFGAQFLAPAEKVNALLPSGRLHALRVTPWQSVVTITAWEYRDNDLGPYNELSIGIPCTLDIASPLFTGILRQPPADLLHYILHLPVTTEIALKVGVEFAGYPKFLADIEFERAGGWLTCHLSQDGESILTVAGRELPCYTAPRYRMHPINARRGRLLRSEFILSEREQGTSKDAGDLRLELGNHPIAQTLADLNLGRLIGCQYSPRCQAILTPVIESFAA
jgi:hypothetical protein